MLLFIRRRALASVIALIGVTVIVFFLAHLTGSPAAIYLPDNASAELIHQFNVVHGFDKPLSEQFLTFLGDVCRLDFGQSIPLQEPAIDAVWAAVPVTLALAAITLAGALVLSLVLGCVAAVYRFRPADKVITVFSLICSSIPEFWFALVAILIFAVDARLLPTSGDATPSSWVLPVLTLMLKPTGVLTQVVRGSMSETLSSGYLIACKARGVSRFSQVFIHGLRNAALPIITVAGDRARGLINGALIVGAVFAFPGIGFLLVNAVKQRDFPTLQAGVFVTGVAILVLNMIVDLIYAFADPRVRVS